MMTVIAIMEDDVIEVMYKTGRTRSLKVTYVLQRPKIHWDTLYSYKDWQCYRCHEIQLALVRIIFKCAIAFTKTIVQLVQRVINTWSYTRHKWNRSRFVENVFTNTLTKSDLNFSLFEFVSDFFPVANIWMIDSCACRCSEMNSLFLGGHISVCSYTDLCEILSIHASMCICAKCWLISLCNIHIYYLSIFHSGETKPYTQCLIFSTSNLSRPSSQRTQCPDC